MRAAGTFSRLISPVTVEDFFHLHWEKAPLHVCRGAADYYDHALTLSELDRYFELGHLSPYFLRVVRNGIECDSNHWTRIEQRKNTDPYRVVDLERLLALFKDGATIVINAAQTAIPNLQALCACLQRELRIGLQTNIYVTPPCRQGLGFHFDPHDVFILQISGTKQWRLYDYDVKLPVVAASLNNDEYEQKAPKELVELGPGDLLYLPRGTVHLARTSAISSVHVTISLMPRYWYSLLERLASVAREDEAFRRALPHGFSSELDKAAVIEEFGERLRNLVAKADVGALLDESEAEFSVDPLAERTTRFSDVVQVDRLTLDSLVSRRNEIPERVTQNADKLIIEFGNESIALPKFMAATLESLLRDAPFAVREVGGPVSESGKLELVKRFVQAGFLRIETL